MACIAKITINGLEISLELDKKESPDSSLTIDTLLKALSSKKNTAQKDDFINLIRNKIFADITGPKPPTVLNLLSLKGLQGNTNLAFLSSEFGVTFPEGAEANVLLVNKLDIKGWNIKNRLLTTNGNELFIVTNNVEDVERLAGFLNIRKSIIDGKANFSEDTEEYLNLQRCLEEVKKYNKKITSVNEMLLDYMYNKKEYNTIYFTDSKGNRIYALSFLQDIANIINDFSENKIYEDPFVSDISRAMYIYNSNNAAIDINALAHTLLARHSDIMERLGIKNPLDLLDLIRGYESARSNKDNPKFEDVLNELFPDITAPTPFKRLLKAVFSAEPEFTWEYKKLALKTTNLIFEKTFVPLKERYDFAKDTTQLFEIAVDDYYGFKIYKFIDLNGKERYIPYKGYIPETALSNIFKTAHTSIERAKAVVDGIIKNSPIKNSAFLEFKFQNNGTIITNLHFDVGTIVEVLDIDLEGNTNIADEERILFSSSENNPLDLFNSTINIWRQRKGLSAPEALKILNEINTQEKIAAFMYLVNGYTNAKGEPVDIRGNTRELNKILNQISNAGKKCFYISDNFPIKNSNKTGYRVIPIDPVTVEEYSKKRPTPALNLLIATSYVMSNLFGITLNNLTAEEIHVQFPEIDINRTRAFVKDGQIYINTTIALASDPFHEYTHIVLGLLKTNPEYLKIYELLMYAISLKDEGIKKMDELREAYPNLSEVDLAEEAFVSLFSEYLINNKYDFKEMFSPLEKASKVIFNTKSNILDLYNDSLENILCKFSSEIGAILQDKSLDFSKATETRRISNFITEQIKNGKIVENCK